MFVWITPSRALQNISSPFLLLLCSSSCSSPSFRHARSMLHIKLSLQKAESGVWIWIHTDKIDSSCFLLPSIYHQSCLTRKVKYGIFHLSRLLFFFWGVTLALPHTFTPSLSSTSCSLPPVLSPLLSISRLLRPPHLTAYPGRTLGDSCTGGCGRGLCLHGTAWSAWPSPLGNLCLLLLTADHFFLFFFKFKTRL